MCRPALGWSSGGRGRFCVDTIIARSLMFVALCDELDDLLRCSDDPVQ